MLVHTRWSCEGWNIAWHLAAGTGSFTNLSPEDILPPPKVSPYKEELGKLNKKLKNQKQQDALFGKDF
jgi:hypothetical protein